MKEEPPVKIQTDKSKKYFGVVRQNFSRDKIRAVLGGVGLNAIIVSIQHEDTGGQEPEEG
jgi:hypothetical protein